MNINRADYLVVVTGLISFLGCENLLKACWTLDGKKIVFVGCGDESAIPDPRLPCHGVLAF